MQEIIPFIFSGSIAIAIMLIAALRFILAT